MNEKLVDCEAGRRDGCATYCCRLIVRLKPGERDPSQPENPHKRCVDKAPRTGLCAVFDEKTSRCTAWEQRPSACREFDCRDDLRSQIVRAEGFHTLTRLLTRAAELEGRQRLTEFDPRSPSSRSNLVGDP